MKERFWVLDGDHRVVEVESIFAWARWFVEHDERRRVARTKTARHVVSTVFLGIDHRWAGRGPPVLFETMTFGKRGDKADVDGFARYSSWDDALAGHNAIVRRVKQAETEEHVR